ncbi:helix-turn-helix domain-containing protein [Methylobacterium sp. CM6247]
MDEPHTPHRLRNGDNRLVSGSRSNCIADIRWFPRVQAVRVRVMDERARVAWHLRRLRVERGLSQKALAVDAGVDRGYVSGIERRSFNPTVDILDRLASALSVDVSKLFALPADNEQPPSPLRPGRRRS